MVALRPLWFRRPGAGECGRDGRDGVCTQGPGAAEYILIQSMCISHKAEDDTLHMILLSQ